MTLSGWGNFPKHEGLLSTPRTETELVARVAQGQVIARGNGRAYGDSAIADKETLHMRHFNHMEAFDPQTGVLIAEAGVILGDIISAFLPRGWFPPVTPGTKFVTLGGMIAADVHGKNHHIDGSFGNFVDWIDILSADGKISRASRKKNRKLFEWTIGGMGLTGIILRAAIRLRPVESAWIRQNQIALPHLDAVIDAFEDAQESTYSVAWIDCLSRGPSLGRSLLMLGEHATHDELKDDQSRYPFEAPKKTKRTFPFFMPRGALNSATVRAFNALYYWNGRRKMGQSYIDWDSYFYPLDAILAWNRLYGRKGFMQFQCVLPLDQSREGLRALLDAISQAKAGSFLAVLKRLGPQESRFSFPMLGYTLALDFPIHPGTSELMEELDQITLQFGGRFYLAKDSRMSAQTQRASDPRTAEFVQMRQTGDLSDRFHSKQSKRLSL